MDSALIGVMLAGAISLATAWVTSNRVLTQIQTKVDILWKVYVEDALSEARQAKMISRNSPLTINREVWEELPRKLRDDIRQSVYNWIKLTKDPYDIALHVASEVSDDLDFFIVESGKKWTLRQLRGMIMAYAIDKLRDA